MNDALEAMVMALKEETMATMKVKVVDQTKIGTMRCPRAVESHVSSGVGLGKNKLEPSKFEESGVCEGNFKKDNGNGNDNNEGKAVRLGSSARGTEAKESESENKSAECFLCHCPHRLRKCLKKSTVEENNRSNKQSKLVVVKEKETSELVESSEGLSPKKDEEVSCASNLEEKVAIQTLKLGLMRFIYVDSPEKLLLKGKVDGASDFVKVVIQTGQLTRVNVASESRGFLLTRCSNKWDDLS
ncbi:hypothetical protein PVK06_007291 [Gossypium arboreum]|uniref:Uncharacterized protein n=1 Tax=Gossypium arboreum TaxID=29729 RepID=A0ABR0QGY7_GOSAR|nr:hypothetical protein PVK06_007291 [Gossypium arboreum]